MCWNFWSHYWIIEEVDDTSMFRLTDAVRFMLMNEDVVLKLMT